MKSVLAVAIAVLLAGSTAFGSLTISADAPTSDVIVSQTTYNDNSSIAWRAESRFFAGQTFTATTDLVTAASLLISQENATDKMSAGMALVLTLWDANGNIAATSGDVLASVNVTTPEFEKGPKAWWTFDLPDTEVTAGNVYGITLDFQYQRNYVSSTDGGHKLGDDYWGWHRQTGMSLGDTYTGGRAFYSVNGNQWLTYVPENDFAFIIQGTDVPEPATMALLGLGAIGALIRRKK